MVYFEKFCRNCPNEAHCCKFDHSKGFTFLTLADANKIKGETGKEFGEFLDFSPLDSLTVKRLNESDPSLEGALRFSQLDSKNRILRLKKQANGNCIFLTKNAKCGIYKSRPNICRIYPFWAVRLLDGKLKVIEHDVNPSCPIILSLDKKAGMENSLPTAQIKSIKKTFEDIEKERATPCP